MNRVRIKVSEYRRKYFSEDSAPDPRTVIARIRRQDIVGEKEGRIWYVYPDEKPSKSDKVTKLIEAFERSRP